MGLWNYPKRESFQKTNEKIMNLYTLINSFRGLLGISQPTPKNKGKQGGVYPGP